MTVPGALSSAQKCFEQRKVVCAAHLEEKAFFDCRNCKQWSVFIYFWGLERDSLSSPGQPKSFYDSMVSNHVYRKT